MADVWSCGVILYALLVGALPFDDDNLRNLLEKVKKGSFQIPPFVPPDCQALLRAMIEVDPKKRISLKDVLGHTWVTSDQEPPLQTELPMSQAVQTSIIPTREDVDPDILSTMASLQCFRNEEKLYEALLSSVHNTEKVIYFLLLDRKIRSPCYEDPDEIRSRSSTVGMCPVKDPPRKRIDSLRIGVNGNVRLSLGDLSEGSPLAGRRGLAVQKLRRKQSASTNLDTRSSTPVSPISSPVGYIKGRYRMSGYETCTPIDEMTDQYRNHSIVSPSRNQAEAPLIVRKHPNVYQGQLLSPSHQQYRFSKLRQPSYRPSSEVTSPTSECKMPVPISPNTIAVDEVVLRSITSPKSPSLIPRPAIITEGSRESTPKSSEILKSDTKVSDANGNVKGNSVETKANEHPANVTSPLSPQHWRSRLNSFRMSLLGSPRFHRKKATVPNTPPESPVDYSSHLSSKNSSRRSSNATPEVSPLLSNKSWFEGFLPLSLHNGGSAKPSHRNNGNGINNVKVPPTPSTGRHLFRGYAKAPSASHTVTTNPASPPHPPVSSKIETPSSQIKRLFTATTEPPEAGKSAIPLPMSAAMRTGGVFMGSGRNDHGLGMHLLPPEETNHVAMVKGRPFNRVKSEITQVLLSTPGVVHTILSPSSFRAEYRRAGSGSSLLARPVKMQIDIVRAATGQAATSNGQTPDCSGDRELYAVSFQLLSGPTRRFKRLCEQLQAPLLAAGGHYRGNLRSRPSPVPAMKQASVEDNPKNFSKPSEKAPLASATEKDSQWSFVDSDANGEAAASSISTLCSQFEATLAINDSQLDSMLSDEGTDAKASVEEKS